MFERLEGLLGSKNFVKLEDVNILLVGIGGVGGTCLDALVRSGIKNITVVDGDVFTESNLNRQVLCTNDCIGKKKVDIAINKMKLINKDINIKGLYLYINEDNINNLENFDFIIDACDDVNAKILLMKYAKSKNIPIISSMGTGKRLDPSSLSITRLDKTEGDPLAKKVRSEARKNNLDLKIPVVASKEKPISTGANIPSSIFVPSSAGLYLAYYVIKKIIES